MASSSLSSYWLSRNRKDLAEQAIVTKREQEIQRLKHWNAISDDFRKADLQSSVYSALINTLPSNFPPKVNIESAKKEQGREAKRKALEIRRSNLSMLLKEEEQNFKMEMEEKNIQLKKSDRWNIDKMKEEIEKLQKLREEEREKCIQYQLYPHRRTNDHIFQKMHSDRFNKHTVLSLQKQLEEKRKNLNKEREQDENFMDELEKHKQEKEKEARDLERFKEEIIDRLNDELDILLQELNRLEKEAQMLKDEELALLKKQQHINELKEKRCQIEIVRKKKELSVLKPPKNRLRQKAIDVTNELKLDQQLLDFLYKERMQDKQIEETQKDESLSDIKWIKNILDEQIALEKECQRELQILYDEEAEIMLKRREGEWNNEREARESLMNNVLEELKCKIQEKIKENLKKRKEKLQRKDQLLKELENLKRKLEEEKEEHFGIKRQFQLDLESRIKNRLSKYEEEKRQIEEELDRIKLLEGEEENIPGGMTDDGCRS